MATFVFLKNELHIKREEKVFSALFSVLSKDFIFVGKSCLFDVFFSHSIISFSPPVNGHFLALVKHPVENNAILKELFLKVKYTFKGEKSHLFESAEAT